MFAALAARLRRMPAAQPVIRVSGSGFMVGELCVPRGAVTRIKASRAGSSAWHDIRIDIGARIGADAAQGAGIVTIALAWPGGESQAAALTLFERTVHH